MRSSGLASLYEYRGVKAFSSEAERNTCCFSPFIDGVLSIEVIQNKKVRRLLWCWSDERSESTCLLPDVILLTQCYLHRGTRLNAMKKFRICSL